MTSDQQEPSAYAPWTRMTLRALIIDAARALLDRPKSEFAAPAIKMVRRVRRSITNLKRARAASALHSASTRPEPEPTLQDSSTRTGSRPRSLSSSTSMLARASSRNPEGRSKSRPDRRSPGVGPGLHHGAPLSLHGDVRRNRGAPPIPPG